MPSLRRTSASDHPSVHPRGWDKLGLQKERKKLEAKCVHDEEQRKDGTAGLGTWPPCRDRDGFWQPAPLLSNAACFSLWHCQTLLRRRMGPTTALDRAARLKFFGMTLGPGNGPCFLLFGSVGLECLLAHGRSGRLPCFAWMLN